MKLLMNIELPDAGLIFRQGAVATGPLARLAACLPLPLVVAGIGLTPPRFAAFTQPNAPSGVFHCGS